jgi:transcriptional regulator with XRE-family HTH domain
VEKHGQSGLLGSSEFGRFVGGRLREERRLADLTRAALGDALGVSDEAVERYEMGQRLLPAHQLAAAAAVLGVPLSALFYDGAWSGEVGEHKRWLAIRRPPKFLQRPDFAQLAPLLRFWQERRGEFGDGVDRALLAGGVFDRTILVRRPPSSSRFETEHFGARFMFLRPSDIVGREFQDQPDREYAAWMADAYAELLACRDLRLEACRAVIRTWNSTTICARYDRLLLPWRWRGSDQFVMCVSLRRGEPAAVSSGTATLSP